MVAMERKKFETGEEAINAAVEDTSGSPDDLQRKLKGNAEDLEDFEKAKVEEHQHGTRNALREVIVEKLPEGVGGLYNGDIKIAKSTLLVHGSIKNTLAMTDEASEHEHLHKKYNHLTPIQYGASADGNTAVTIGTKEFTDTGIHEAITVEKTGNRFVSQEYRHYQSDLRSGLAAAGLTMQQAHEAINVKRDLSLIDDASRSISK